MAKGAEDDVFVSLAKKAVEEFVRFGRLTPAPETVPAELEIPSGAFVCMKRNGELRGCIGTIEATQSDLSTEIIKNAINAAVCDPRFEPVSEDELDDLVYSVDILGAAEPVISLDDLDPKKYGVIVESGCKRGLLLPDLEGVDTVEDQLSIAMRKACIREGEPVNIYRFQVTRHGAKG